MIKKTFASAMKEYFGLKDGETTSGFMAEMKALTEKDKNDFRAMLPSVGYEIVTTMTPAVAAA